MDQDGLPSGNIFVVSDITANKRTEEALKLSERLAATGRLAHSIAHEINNPLESIINLLYLMEHTSDVAELRSYITLAMAALERVSRITKQTLAFYRESTTPVELDLSELLDSVISLHGPQLASRNISVRRQYDRKAAIEGFPSALQQALANFVSNAIDATHKGGQITLRVSRSCEWSNSRRPGVRILVADSGEGIPSELRERIFDAFFTTKGTKGSGLGLWLSMGTIQKHSGHVRLRSSTQPGRSGTCFSIFLPARPGIPG
jgi:signal transduction histidine kinase